MKTRIISGAVLAVVTVAVDRWNSPSCKVSRCFSVNAERCSA